MVQRRLKRGFGFSVLIEILISFYKISNHVISLVSYCRLLGFSLIVVNNPYIVLNLCLDKLSRYFGFVN